jgi:hypothetical protein
LLAVSDESASMIEKFIPTKEINYPTAAGGSAATLRSWGVKGFPSAYLIDHEGIVIWEGHPGELSHGIIEEAVARAEADGPWVPGERHEVLDKAVKMAEEGKMGGAWKAAESARKKATEMPEAVAAIDAFQAEILERGQRQLAKSVAMTEDGRYFQAAERLEAQLAIYKGAPFEDEWKETLKTWTSSKECKEEYGLDKKRRSALQAAREGDMEKAVKELQKLIEKAEGLTIEARIRADYEAIRSI